ncbi:YeiH family protein [Mesobacillus zeae]|uniref:YeiH family protein n=1 Tax=Mesobacillus zeae TaxID=1917180 RepID=A0A398BBD3_9BACI|nr:YeiH family protein [Mesobacillus zeae]RID86751.1 YeiH family protein [Mesobacillus zeae]
MEKTKRMKQQVSLAFMQGIGMTLLIAIAAKYLAQLPFLSIMGQLVLAILIGMGWRAVFGVRESLQPGVTFASKKLLRLGIILLGMRLNLADIYHAGLNVFAIAAINLVFALVVVYLLTRWLGVEKKLGILTACGTAICGAAAVVAIAPQIKAKDDETAIAAAIVAILGTLFTLVYTVFYSVLNLSPTGYGVFAGGTLHELAHVIAAAAAGGKEAVDLAVIVKLTRVALLVPVALVIGWIFRSKETKGGGKAAGISMSIVPWFIFGFLAMSGFNTLGIVSAETAENIVSLAYLFLGMAMAGLGLNVDLGAFRKWGLRSFAAGLVGSVFLSVLGYCLVWLFGLN